MKRSTSLRLRLFVIILAPLLAVAAALSLWRLDEARQATEELFDRSLILTAVAVSRDVSLLEGNLISPRTEALLRDAAGGPVRYHVFAPNGAFVLGYAVPPVPLSRSPSADRPVIYLDVVYRGRPVRVLRMLDVTEIGGFAGTYTITVWQDMGLRQRFVRRIERRNLSVIAALLGSLAVIVWFGVKLGLKPLLELEDAISRRSPEDLSAIRRAVPPEAGGLVVRLNHLFGQTRAMIAAQNAFISDAAHQLRNPLAGIRALADSILTARSLETARSRAGELVRAAGAASTLADRLLTLERVRALPVDAERAKVDMRALARRLVADLADRAEARGVTLRFEDRFGGDAPVVTGDALMLREMLGNLIDNALAHGGPGLSRIGVCLSRSAAGLEIEVADDGIGIGATEFPKALARFGQVGAGSGSGLGLPIAEAVARQHGGTLVLSAAEEGLVVRVTLPTARRSTAWD